MLSIVAYVQRIYNKFRAIFGDKSDGRRITPPVNKDLDLSFVMLNEAKNLKQNKYKMCETRFFGYRLRMKSGGHGFSPKTGTLLSAFADISPVRGITRPYNCKLRSCRFFESGGDFLSGIECQNALGEGVRIGFAPK